MLMPSWWSRNTPLRLSASIMEFPHAVEKSSLLAQDPGRQQIRLGVKGRSLQPAVLALAHHPLHVLRGELQVLQQHPFKLVASVRILGHLPHGLQHQSGMSFPDGLAERSGPAKVAVRQLFNLPHAELLPAQGHYELLDLLLVEAWQSAASSYSHSWRRCRTDGNHRIAIRASAAKCNRHGSTYRPRSNPCALQRDRKSTRLNSSHGYISYAVFCLKKKKKYDV